MIDVSPREARILLWHYAGKAHTAIARIFELSTGQIRQLVLKAADGYKVRKDLPNPECYLVLTPVGGKPA